MSSLCVRLSGSRLGLSRKIAALRALEVGFERVTPKNWLLFWLEIWERGPWIVVCGWVRMWWIQGREKSGWVVASFEDIFGSVDFFGVVCVLPRLVSAHIGVNGMDCCGIDVSVLTEEVGVKRGILARGCSAGFFVASLLPITINMANLSSNDLTMPRGAQLVMHGLPLE